MSIAVKPWSQRPIRSDSTGRVESDRALWSLLRSDPTLIDSTGVSVFNQFWTFWRLSSWVGLSCKRDHSARSILIRFNATDRQSWPSFMFLLLGESPTYLLNLYWNKLTHLFFLRLCRYDNIVQMASSNDADLLNFDVKILTSKSYRIERKKAIK